MPIFDQGYQHWNGTLSGHAWRWLAVTRQGVRAHWRKRGTKFLLVAAWTPAVALVGFLALWGLLEQGSDLVKPFLPILEAILPPAMREGPKAFRSSVWTIAFHLFFQLEIGLSMLVVLTVGPDLISQDLRFNAIPLYFARPLTRRDYFLGKLGVILAYLSAVTVLPALIAYLVGVAFSLDLGVVRDTWHLLVGGVGFGLVAAVCSGLVMLAFSSLSRNSRYVALMWVGLWFISNGVAGALVGTVNRRDAEKPLWAISYTSNLYRVEEAMLDTARARDQLNSAFQELMQRAPEAVAGPRFLLGGSGRSGRGPFGRRRGPAPPPPPPPGAADGAASEYRPFDWLVQPFPWTISAAVLGGWCVASAWTLSTRVKSLDRLR